MKNLLTFIILLPIVLTGQEMSVDSFNSMMGDMTARVTHPVEDQNGDKCALIKMVTSETGFVFDGDMNGISDIEYKTGEYWIYVPYGSKSITIKHEEFGMVRNYRYPIPIKEATVYELVLFTPKSESNNAAEMAQLKDSIIDQSKLETERILIERENRKQLEMYYGMVNKYNRNKKILFISSAITAGIGGYFAYSANNLYTNEYPTATDNATRIHEQIVNQKMIWMASAGVSATCLISAVIYSRKEKKTNNTLQNLSAIIKPYDKGAGISLTYNF